MSIPPVQEHPDVHTGDTHSDEGEMQQRSSKVTTPQFTWVDCTPQPEPTHDTRPPTWNRVRRQQKERRNTSVPKDPPPIDTETALAALHIEPSVTDGVPAEDFMAMLGRMYPPELLENLFNRTDKKLSLKLKMGCSNEKEMFQHYQQFFAGQLNERIPTLRRIIFQSEDQARLCLCHVLRSYLPGFCVHKKESWKNQDGTQMASFWCHTMNHRKNKTDTVSCTWEATVKQQEDGTFMFERIDDFSVHKKECVMKHSRHTKLEVQYQRDFNKSARERMMLVLNQPAVDPATIRKQKSRVVSGFRGHAEKIWMDRINSQEPDFSLTNLSEFHFQMEGLPDETLLIIKYLSYLKKTDGLESLMVFHKERNGDVFLSQIHFMWPQGHELLKTCGDVIFSDSLWNVSYDSDFLLSIVVVDKNYELKLASFSLATSENKETWREFYRWVKEKVPEFAPKCVTTDGADYIYHGFRDATGTTPLKVNCLWHLLKANKACFGLKRHLKHLLIQMSYSESHEELESILCEVTAKLKGLNARGQSQLLGQLKNTVETAFINLPVFTGNTLTNSYAESVNGQLRANQIDTSEPLIHQIKRLREFSVQTLQRLDTPITPHPDLMLILAPETITALSNGMLKCLNGQITLAKSNCQRIGQFGATSMIEERVTCIANGIELEKRTTWNVTWDGECAPNCTCNCIVYGGMPCKHIIWVAIHSGQRIPVQCFHQRFLVQQLPLLPVVPEQAPEEAIVPELPPEEMVASQTIQSLAPDNEGELIQAAADSYHAEDFSLSAKFNNPRSCLIRAKIQSVERELLESSIFAPEATEALTDDILRMVSERTQEIAAQHHATIGKIPHSQVKNTPRSYKTTPQKVRKLREKALKRAPVINGANENSGMKRPRTDSNKQ